MAAPLPVSSIPDDAPARYLEAGCITLHRSQWKIKMECRDRCGACCIAPSISSPIPGMPDGKPAGVRCSQLDDALRCRLFGRPERPICCAGLQASIEMCGQTRVHAMQWLTELERLTAPS